MKKFEVYIIHYDIPNNKTVLTSWFNKLCYNKNVELLDNNNFRNGYFAIYKNADIRVINK